MKLIAIGLLALMVSACGSQSISQINTVRMIGGLSSAGITEEATNCLKDIFDPGNRGSGCWLTNDSKDSDSWRACVGLSWQGGTWLTAIRRSECWTDMVSRPWPWYLRFIPTSWVSWDRNGARFKLFHKERMKKWLEKQRQKKTKGWWTSGLRKATRLRYALRWHELILMTLPTLGYEAERKRSQKKKRNKETWRW